MRDDVLTHDTMCMGLENVVLSETSQTGKDKHCMIPLRGSTWNSPITETRQTRGYQGLGTGTERDLLCNEYRIYLGADNVLGEDSGDGYTIS